MNLARITLLALPLTLCGLAAHAQTAPATPEAVYTALTGRIDGLVSQNSALANAYAKLLACNNIQKFYAPDAPGADAQGCAGGMGSSVLGGGKWARIACGSGDDMNFLRARALPDCPSANMQGQTCGDIGQRCKVANAPARNCHLGEHENSHMINGFICQ